MSLRGVTIKEGTIGTNVAGDSREFGLICNGVSVAEKAQLATAYKLKRASDAVAIGIDATYDSANNVNVYRHISEFYRRAGDGAILHLMLVAQTVKPADMVPFAKTLAVESGGMISDMAFAYNPATGYSETQTDGFNTDCRAAIQPLQVFAEWADSQDMPLHTILEGRAMSDVLSSAVDLRDLVVAGNDFDANKVTVVAGQDWNYADGLNALGKKFADVGTFLGCVASQEWNRNPGEVATQNLTDATLSVWVVGGLSSHKKYSEVYDSLETLNDKGYVFPIRYQGLSGYWWNDGHVCSRIVLDAAGNMNQHTIYYSHAMDQSKRVLRIAFLPEVKRSDIDLEDGLLPSGMIGYYNAIGDKAFEDMGKLISKGSTAVDPESDLLIEKVLNVGFSVVPTGCVNGIAGTINLKNS